MRVRDRSQTRVVTGTYRETSREGSVVYSGNQSVLVTDTDIMSDVVTPGFKTRSSRGEVVISDMEKCVGTISIPGQTWFCQGSPDDLGRRAKWEANPWLPSQVIGKDPISYPGLREAMTRVIGIATTDAAANVGKADVESLVSVAELRETIEFLSSPVKKMVSLTRRFRSWRDYRERVLAKYQARAERYAKLPEKIRLRRQAPEKPVIKPFKVGDFTATDIGSAWLAYRYGLMPLIYEFEGIAKFLREGPQPMRATARARASETFKHETSGSSVEGDEAGTGRIRVTTEDQFRARIDVRSGFLYEVDWSIQARLGLSPSRVPATLYELIPLSFVADWFWNGASYYDALTATCRAKAILGGWSVAKVTYEYQQYRTVTAAGPQTTVGGGSKTLVLRESGVYTIRQPRSTRDAEVHLRVALNTKRVADGFALILQLLSGRKGK